MAIKINNNTIIDDSRNIASAGVVTATSTVVGSAVTINSSGLNVAGIVTATSFVGDGSGLTGVGIGSTGNVNTSGIITASAFVGDGSGLTNLPSSEFSDGFIPEDQKLISVDTTLNNSQSNISFAEDLVIGTGVTFTVSTGSTVRMDALSVIDAISVTADEVNLPSGETASRPVSPVTGTIRYNTSTSSLEYYNGTGWVSVSNLSGTLLSSGETGIFGGGYTPGQSASSQIDYITISTTGNASIFGTLTDSRRELGSCSNSTRGIFAGGDAYYLVPAVRERATIDAVNFSSTGSAFGFGNLIRPRSGLQGLSNSTRGVFGGGYSSTPISPSGQLNVIEYITIANSGDTTDFGDLTVTRKELSACSSSTRGVFAGGYPTNGNVIDYITIATTGNATDFGDLTVARGKLAACSSSTRGVFGGGYGPATNTIDYITIATTGNATDFGDLTVLNRELAACSSSTRGVFGGGFSSNVINYITIATTGNATDFGDLVTMRSRLSGASNGHGGLS